MFEEKRLHPTTIFFNFFQFLKEFALPIILGFFTFRGQALFYLLIILVAIFIINLVFSIASWYRFTYRVEDGELRIEHGIFVRKKRYISINRIQSINLTQSVFHRLFKLTKVQIETAGGSGQAEASLKAVTFEEGELLRTKLKSITTEEHFSVEQVDESTNPTDKISARRLFIAGTTSGSIGVLAAFFAFFVSQVEQLIPGEVFDKSLEWVFGLNLTLMIGLGLIVLIILWILGIAGTMIKYGNFTITKNDDELFITRGLLEKKQITIPLKRIQAVGIEESLLRQPFGFAVIYVEVAGGSLEKGEDFSTALFPILKINDVDDFIERYLPIYKSSVTTLNNPPKRAIWHYLFRSSFLFFIIACVFIFILPHFIWIAFLLFASGLLQGFLKYKDSGYANENNRITVRYRRGISRTTIRIFQNRIQAVEIKQHKFQQWMRLATAKLSIIGLMGSGTHYYVKELEDKDVTKIFDWYSYREL